MWESNLCPPAATAERRQYVSKQRNTENHFPKRIWEKEPGIGIYGTSKLKNLNADKKNMWKGFLCHYQSCYVDLDVWYLWKGRRQCYLDLGSENSERDLHKLNKICWTKFPKSNQITEQMAEITEKSLNSLSKYE